MEFFYNTKRNLVYEHLNSFNDFLIEGLDTINFIISDRLKDILEQIDSPISNRLLSDSEEGNKKNITLLDIDDTSTSTWCFVNSVKVIQYLSEIESPVPYYRTIHHLKNKQEILNRYKSTTRIGRIIGKLYNNDFSNTEIEKFVNDYKQTFIVNFYLIDIIKGEKMLYWYNRDQYTYEDDTPLQNSCMSGNDQNEYIKFYVANEDKVSLVIMYEDDKKKKIKARALLWKIDDINGSKVNDKLFMDRVYYNYEDDKNTMLKYAKINNWYSKISQNSKPSEYIYDPKTNKSEQINFTVTDIKYPENHKFPYVDTLSYIDVNNNTLSNNRSFNGSKTHRLDDLYGGCDGVVWSKYYNNFFNIGTIGTNGILYARVNDNEYDYILRKDTVYLKVYDNYYLKEYFDSCKTMKVKRINGEYDSIFSSDALYSKKHKRYFYKNDVRLIDFGGKKDFLPYTEIVRSSHLRTFLPKDESVEVIIDDSSYVWSIEELNKDTIHAFNFTYDNFPKMDTPNEYYFKYCDKYFGNQYKKIIKIKNEDIK